jgi:hypothetical protein
MFPVFRSRVTAEVLTRIYVGDGEYSIAELAGMAKTGTGTMTREVRRLETAGILRSRTVGRAKLVRADKDAPFYRALRDLVVIVLGPAEVLGEELRGWRGSRRRQSSGRGRRGRPARPALRLSISIFW